MPNNVTCDGRTLEGIVRGTNFRLSIGDREVESGTPENGLVQQFQMQFQRQLSRVYDLQSPSFYYLEGPAEGVIQFTKVVGPCGGPNIHCDCTPVDIVLDAGQAFCYPEEQLCADIDVAYTLKNALPQGLTGQGSAENFMIIFGVSYLFSHIETNNGSP